MRNKLFALIALLALPLVGCGETPTTTSSPEESYFNITIENSENGSVKCDKDKVKPGDFATFYFEPNNGYEILNFKVNNQSYPTDLGHYTVVNIQEDLTVNAKFGVADIIVRYIVDEKVVQVRKVSKGTDASYVGALPTKDMTGGKIYAFKAWSLSPDGEPITSFVFNESTDIYGTFEELHYNLSMVESLDLRTLASGDLELVTDYPENIVKSALIVNDPAICSLDADYNVTALKSGTTSIDFKLGDTVIKSCQVTVNNIDNARIKKVYPAATGEVTYNDNYSVGQLKACQSNLTNVNGTYISQKYVDFSVDLMFSGSVTDTDNFGIQVCKEIGSNGSVSKCYQFGGFTGSSNNIFLKVNGSKVVTASYNLEPGVTYNFRVVTEVGNTSSQVRVKGYINDTLVINSLRGLLNEATDYIGIRYANSNNNYITFSNVYLAS